MILFHMNSVIYTKPVNEFWLIVGATFLSVGLLTMFVVLVRLKLSCFIWNIFEIVHLAIQF